MILIEILANAVIPLEIAALLVGILSMNKYRSTPTKYFLFYLLLVVGIELTAGYVAYNQWLYNILGLSEILILVLVFYNSLLSNKFKRIIVALLIVVLLAAILEIIFVSDSIADYLNFSMGLSSISIAVMCFIYLNDVARTEKILNLSRILLFWIVVGLLVYHLCVLPFTVMVHQLPEIGNTQNLITIQYLASIVMYSCFIIGFIWTQKKYNI